MLTFGMVVFDYESYKSCVNDWIRSQAKSGHGQLRKLAAHLGINSVVMSQVFRGDRDLTLEQAFGTSEFMGLTDFERDYFLLLVQKERAGTHQLKSVFENQLRERRQAAQALKNRIKHQKLTDADRAVFYSDWIYSAVRLGVSIPAFASVSAVAEYLKLGRSDVAGVLDFLLKHKLVIEKGGTFELGPSITHVGHDSPHVNRHHTNWRLRSLQSLDKKRKADLFYTGPMALSEDAAAKIRKLLIQLVQDSTQIAAPSNSETLRCLTIDWFEVGDDLILRGALRRLEASLQEIFNHDLASENCSKSSRALCPFTDRLFARRGCADGAL